MHDREELSRVFTDLCVRVAGDLERKGCLGRTIGLKIRYDNFKTVTRDCTIEAPTRDAGVIRRAARECLKRVPLERRIRLRACGWEVEPARRISGHRWRRRRKRRADRRVV